MAQAQRRPQGGGLKRRALEFFARARREHSSPPEIGFSVAVGVFSACTPLLGLHTWMALAAATLLRLNRLWAVLGSRMPMFIWIAFCEIQVAHRLRSGAWASLAPSDVTSHGRQLLTDWIAGTVIVGGVLAAATGLVAYALARRWSRPTTTEADVGAQTTPGGGAAVPVLERHDGGAPG
jgi:uncharacterized protein (DUF2062 family)